MGECNYLLFCPMLYIQGILGAALECNSPRQRYYLPDEWDIRTRVFRLLNLFFNKLHINYMVHKSDDLCIPVMFEICLLIIVVAILIGIVISIIIIINSKKLFRGDLIMPWKYIEYSKKNNITPPRQEMKNAIEFYLGFLSFFVKVPVYMMYCKNGCGKQTMRYIGECIHCSYYRRIYNREPPINEKRVLMILMMHKRNDNLFNKLPKDLVRYFIENYILN